MWDHIGHVIAHWPWSTIAAFAAVAVTISIARSQTRQQALLLGRQVVVEVAAASARWSMQSVTFQGDTQRLLDEKAPPRHFHDDALVAPMMAATHDMIGVLQSARMACNDFEMQLGVAGAEREIAEFLMYIGRHPPPGSVAELHARFEAGFDARETALDAFGSAIDRFVQRGYAVYSPPRSRRYKRAERQFNRKLVAPEQDQEPEQS